MIKDGGLSFKTRLKIAFLPPNNDSKKCFFYGIKIPADVCETCNFLINFPEKCYFQFFVVLTTKNA